MTRVLLSILAVLEAALGVFGLWVHQSDPQPCRRDDDWPLMPVLAIIASAGCWRALPSSSAGRGATTSTSP